MRNPMSEALRRQVLEIYREADREVAAAGVNMPPKSTYFFPKLLTGLVFNPLA